MVGIAEDVGEAEGVAPAVLIGIASRESRLGDALNACRGDNGNAMTAWQIDQRFHPDWARRHRACDHRAGARKAARLLKQYRQRVPSLKAAVAAYNAGPESVTQALSRGLGPDAPTTGGDYASDVLRRTRWARPFVEGLSQPTRLAGLAAPLVLFAGLALATTVR